MKSSVYFLLLTVVALSCSRPTVSEQSPTDGSAPAQKVDSPSNPQGGAAQLQTAVFSVPGINDELVKKFAEALAAKEGLVSAQADREKGLFKVAFLPGKISEKEILALLQKVMPEVTLQSTEGAVPPPQDSGHDCGGCPYHNTCEKKH